ncbi:hypothetical protein HYH02_010270 [Chlamydomonas schloesseri]|uniref:Uncharacterized protein n=1 Tax=Chlamydomonas schloesseri TaxID=2026947 RepID=A0A835T8L2_9CHLO|nr:hypothetical protein HYH02_010270 [Chlamydomonas schloesseri]|eukprot:KAG2440693.1 hypothetical protein HYH02_010270 [Chlamydomonas schloesseri]
MSSSAHREPIAPGAQTPWAKLSPALILAIADFTNDSEVAGVLKLLNKATAQCLKAAGARYRKVQLSRRIPKCGSDDGKEYWHLHLTLAAQPWPRGAFLAHWGRPQPWRALNLNQRRRMLAIAASSGDADSLDVAMAHCGCSLATEVVTAAAAAGCGLACERLLSLGCDVDAGDALVAAAGAGYDAFCAVMELMPGKRLDVTYLRAVGAVACRCGHERLLDCLLGIVEREKAYTPKAVLIREWTAAAAHGGQVGLLDRLAPQMGDEDRLDALGAFLTFMSSPSLNEVLSLADRQSVVLSHIAHGCSLEVLQRYLAAWGWRAPDPARPCMARNEYMGMVGAAAGSPTPDAFAKVDWLLAQLAAAAAPGGRQGGGAAAAAAAARPAAAQLPARLPRDVYMSLEAAGRCPDFLARLQQLEARGFADFAAAAEVAARMGRTDALAYLLTQRRVAPSLKLLHEAERFGHVPVLRLLRQRGLRLSAAVHCEPELLRVLPQDWAAEAVSVVEAHHARASLMGCEETPAALFRAAAAAGAGLRVLRALHAAGAPIDLQAVAVGGSERDLIWAVATLQAEQPLRALTREDVWRILCGGYPRKELKEARSCDRRSDLLQDICGIFPWEGTDGNFATVAWLQSHGVAPRLDLPFLRLKFARLQSWEPRPAFHLTRITHGYQKLQWAMAQVGWEQLTAKDWRNVRSCLSWTIHVDSEQPGGHVASPQQRDAWERRREEAAAAGAVAAAAAGAGAAAAAGASAAGAGAAGALVGLAEAMLEQQENDEEEGDMEPWEQDELDLPEVSGDEWYDLYEGDPDGGEGLY